MVQLVLIDVIVVCVVWFDVVQLDTLCVGEIGVLVIDLLTNGLSSLCEMDVVVDVFCVVLV